MLARSLPITSAPQKHTPTWSYSGCMRVLICNHTTTVRPAQRRQNTTPRRTPLKIAFHCGRPFHTQMSCRLLGEPITGLPGCALDDVVGWQRKSRSCAVSNLACGSNTGSILALSYNSGVGYSGWPHHHGTRVSKLHRTAPKHELPAQDVRRRGSRRCGFRSPCCPGPRSQWHDRGSH